jgi:flagellar hook assembly protein FlgD
LFKIIFYFLFLSLAPLSLRAQTARFTLDHNVFRPATGAMVTTTFTASYAGKGTLAIYNTAGEIILTLFPVSAGSQVAANQTYSMTWDGKDAAGKNVAAGIYIFHLNLNLGSYEKGLVVLR